MDILCLGFLRHVVVVPSHYSSNNSCVCVRTTPHCSKLIPNREKEIPPHEKKARGHFKPIIFSIYSKTDL